jgi:ABC-type transport system involved in multi-copper enzyme maturation permease subunit
MATLNPTGIASLWRELVSNNPMTIEVGRFRRRFLEGTRSRNLNTTILVLALVAYASLIVVLSNMAGALSPSVIIFVQTGTFVLLAPTFMYSAIAGEREKRTWDLLLAAPVTHAQIIVGKFLAGLAGLGATFVLFLLPTLFTSYTFGNDFNMMSTDAAGTPLPHAISGTAALLNEEFISITFGIMLLAATLLFSARCRRSLMSLSVMLVSLFMGLLAVPALVMTFEYSGNGPFMDLTSFFHPFLAIEKIEELYQMSSPVGNSFGYISPSGFGVLQGLLYLAMTAVFLVWAFKTVNFADGEKKFMPGKPNA